MSKNLSPIPEQNTYRLAGSLEIDTAETVRSAILERLCPGAALTLDLGSVAACDAAGAQVLLAAKKTAEQAQNPLHFANIPASVSDCWRRLGLPAGFFHPHPL